ncbi:hypothetical protein PPL_06985 [Heterostelium album PN500]|uniref:Uncharacterized protein n=1 Tax=Heterostelium pallidum (strain ATCC 26659 / Pp 5 / PN500) TaxID=670386 RepID=D3BE32_HETP5|nr:hypothetical protein PPL_06985 [Heterostelium album PN500]EFA80163.1 hypothetical protein PPL_06985 [Heterostelium album PN500]|eukprot:XP_020432283.1 hypothetical protein PPL_06985 [Heterostelium album PN500]
MAKSSIDIYEKLHDYENAEEMSQMLGGGGGGGANQDRVANEYEHDPAFGPLPIFFYPNQFTKYSQLLTATDPLSVALLTATLTIAVLEQPIGDSITCF